MPFIDCKVNIDISKQQEQELAREEHKVNMRDMLHRIDQSDLNWREKLDEYDRIRQNLLFRDSLEHKEQAAQAEYQSKHTMLQYTAEETALMQAVVMSAAQSAKTRQRARISARNFFMVSSLKKILYLTEIQ